MTSDKCRICLSEIRQEIIENSLKPFKPMQQNKFEILLCHRDQKNVNVLVEYHEEILKLIERLEHEKCDLQNDIQEMIDENQELRDQI